MPGIVLSYPVTDNLNQYSQKYSEGNFSILSF